MQSIPANIRLGWKKLTVTNTLAYYDMEVITAVKSFVVEFVAPGSVYIRYLLPVYKRQLKKI